MAENVRANNAPFATTLDLVNNYMIQILDQQNDNKSNRNTDRNSNNREGGNLDLAIKYKVSITFVDTNVWLSSPME